MIFIPISLPRQVIQNSHSTHLLLKDALRTGLGMGMGRNGAAHYLRTSEYSICIKHSIRISIRIRIRIHIIIIIIMLLLLLLLFTLLLIVVLLSLLLLVLL